MATVTGSQVRHIRQLALARKLHSRLFIDGSGRIFVASGTVVHGPLARTFERIARVPSAAEAPRPADFGIVCNGELTPRLLQEFGQALHRIGSKLENELRHRGAQRRRLDLIMRDYCEVDRLTARLALLHRVRRERAAGVASAGLPYFLDADTEAAWQVILDDVRRNYHLSPLAEWQSRVVCWLSGLTAAQRFLTAAGEALAAYPSTVRTDPVVAFRQSAKEWLERSELETPLSLSAEINRRIRTLPPEAARHVRVSLRRRGRALATDCRRLIERCDAYLADEEDRMATHVLAELAALLAADDCCVSFPKSSFRYDAKLDFFSLVYRRIRYLAAYIGHPAYGDLLLTLESRPHKVDDFSFRIFCEMVGDGTSPDDAAWVCEHELYYALTDSELTVAEARRLDEEFTAVNCELTSRELYGVLEKSQYREMLPAVRAWLAWVGSVSPSAITKKVRATLISSLRRSYLPAVRSPERSAQLASLLAPARRCNDNSDYASILERIADYRRGPVDDIVPPKSLRKLLDLDETRRRERDYLERRAAAGPLDVAVQARLARLRAAIPAAPDADKIRRAAEEVFLRLGIEAVERKVREITEAECREELGDLCDSLPRDRLPGFAFWIDGMSATERTMLRAVVAARADYGRDYKRFLEENQAWVSAAFARGIDVDAWFAPDPEFVRIGNRHFEIAVAGDLHDLFQMGTYFRTCLSQGGINEMSTLTNAYDADKQVVFLYALDDEGKRTVVGRQLIAVTADYKLLGYRRYLHRHRVEKNRFADTLRAMSTYAARLAARCGLEPANEGEAKGIGEHFWYDDGAEEWPDEARMAWLRETKTADARQPVAKERVARERAVKELAAC